MTREYMSHRQAYFPRLWPIVVGAAVPMMAVSFLVSWHWWMAPIMVAWGVAVAYVRLWVWKRRHPVLTADQLRRTWAEAAPWN